MMEANPADGNCDDAVVLPYILSSQFSTLVSIVILGRRANSRMLYLSKRAGSVIADVLSDLVSSRLEV